MYFMNNCFPGPYVYYQRWNHKYEMDYHARLQADYAQHAQREFRRHQEYLAWRQSRKMNKNRPRNYFQKRNPNSYQWAQRCTCHDNIPDALEEKHRQASRRLSNKHFEKKQYDQRMHSQCQRNDETSSKSFKECVWGDFEAQTNDFEEEGGSLVSPFKLHNGNEASGQDSWLYYKMEQEDIVDQLRKIDKQHELLMEHRRQNENLDPGNRESESESDSSSDEDCIVLNCRKICMSVRQLENEKCEVANSESVADSVQDNESGKSVGLFKTKGFAKTENAALDGFYEFTMSKSLSRLLKSCRLSELLTVLNQNKRYLVRSALRAFISQQKRKSNVRQIMGH